MRAEHEARDANGVDRDRQPGIDDDSEIEPDSSLPPPPPPLPAPVPLVERARHRPLVALAVVGLVAWIAGLAGAVVGTKLAQEDRGPGRTPSTLGLVRAAPRSEALPAMDVFAAASTIGPSVVAIDVVAEQSGNTLRGSGTGVVLTKDGEIITNDHVVNGAVSVHVLLPGETEPRDATVLATDAAHDLALLKISADSLRPAEFADPADVRVGDEVAAVGFALGLDGDPSVTEGIVSALNRTSADDKKALKGLIQTDAPISSGNSGGPLVNSLGQVIGIVTFVAVADAGSQANNLGFAISNRELLPQIEQLRAQVGGEAPPAGFLGVQLASRQDGGSGALVTDVVTGSPADLAGLVKGDAVVSVDGVEITGEAGMVATIRDHAPGDALTIVLRREGKELTVTATLVARPAD